MYSPNTMISDNSKIPVSNRRSCTSIASSLPTSIGSPCKPPTPTTSSVNWNICNQLKSHNLSIQYLTKPKHTSSVTLLDIGCMCCRSGIVHQTMDNAIVEEATGQQCPWIGLQNVTVEDEPHNFVVGQFGGKVTSDVCDLSETKYFSLNNVYLFFIILI